MHEDRVHFVVVFVLFSRQMSCNSLKLVLEMRQKKLFFLFRFDDFCTKYFDSLWRRREESVANKTADLTELSGVQLSEEDAARVIQRAWRTYIVSVVPSHPAAQREKKLRDQLAFEQSREKHTNFLQKTLKTKTRS